MSELALTLMRVGFLALLWFFVIVAINVLRRDLAAPSTTALAENTSTRTKPTRQGRARPQNLVVVEGSLAGTVLPLGTMAVTIGRASDCSLVIDDDFASSHHAKLFQAEGRWIVEDTGSTNGTWIGRTRITGPTVLEPGSPLRIGRTVMELRK